MATTFMDFLQSWVELDVRTLTDIQLATFLSILSDGMQEVEEEIALRQQNKHTGLESLMKK